MLREVIKYSKHPEKIFPRLRDKLGYYLNYHLAKIWFKLRGRDKLRGGKKYIFLFGGFGGRRYDDNSVALFEYMVKNHTEIDSYWVMRKDCFFDKTNERQIPFKDRVVFKDSFYANILALVADVHIYSHGRYDITDYKSCSTRYVTKVMLDHGFTALKKTTMEFMQSGECVAEGSLNWDLIAASSVVEAKIHNGQWGIPQEKISITGLARHDRLYSLEKTMIPSGNNVLFMPTWREWNSKKVCLSRSDFFIQIKAFLIDSGLDVFLSKSGIHLQIYVHMWMREFFEEFRRFFTLKSVEVLDQGIDLQRELLLSSLLITDYSSICWDFLFLNRPVLFYQFDLAKYLRYTGSYIDLKNDLFGPAAYNAEEAVYWVRYFIENGFSTSLFQDKMDQSKKFAFAYRDGKNCERLTQVLQDRILLNKVY